MTSRSQSSQITSRTELFRWAIVEIRPASASPARVWATGLIRMAGWNRTVMTRRSCGRRTRYTLAGTVSFGTTLMPIDYLFVVPRSRLDRGEETRKAVRGVGEQGPDVMHEVRGVR